MTIPFLGGLGLFAALFLAARRAPEPEGAGPRILVLAGTALGLVAGLNYVVNPFGLFAPRLVEPILLHSRAEKLRLLEAVPPPQVVILGSSPSFTLSPAYLTRKTGRSAFNASVHGASPRDYEALLRYMLAHRIVPRTLIVALSFEQVRPGARVDFEPHDPLSAYLPGGPAPSRLGDAGSLLGFAPTEASLRALWASLRGRGEPFYRFDPDGQGHLAKQADSGLEEALVRARAAIPNLRFEDLDPAQWGHLQALFEECRRRGIGVIVYLPPYHPRLTELWEARTSLLAIKGRLLGRLAAYSPEPLLAVHDFSHVESFGGSDALFHDARHPDEEANRLMLDVLSRDLR